MAIVYFWMFLILFNVLSLLEAYVFMFWFTQLRPLRKKQGQI
jgi:hypothetical protein